MIIFDIMTSSNPVRIQYIIQFQVNYSCSIFKGPSSRKCLKKNAVPTLNPQQTMPRNVRNVGECQFSGESNFIVDKPQHGDGHSHKISDGKPGRSNILETPQQTTSRNVRTADDGQISGDDLNSIFDKPQSGNALSILSDSEPDDQEQHFEGSGFTPK